MKNICLFLWMNDVAPMVLLGCRTDGAIGMSLRWCYWDVAPTELYGCRSYGAIWMSHRWSCLDVAPMVLLGCRSYGAVWMSLLRSCLDVAPMELSNHSCFIAALDECLFQFFPMIALNFNEIISYCTACSAEFFECFAECIEFSGI